MAKNDVLPRTPSTPKRKVSMKTTLILILSVLALLLSLGAFISAQLGLHQYQMTRQGLDNLAARETQRVSQMVNVQHAFDQTVKQRLEQLEDHVGQLIEQRDQVSLSQARMHAEQLLQLAQWQVSFNVNGGDAIHLLELADRQLYGYDADSLKPLKATIKNDLMTLKALPQLDIANLLNSLDQLIEEVKQIPVDKPPALHAETSVVEDNTSARLSYWDKLGQSLGKLSNLISVRRVDSQADFLLTPHQTSLAKQVIIAKLIQAQWAVLNGEPAVFTQSLLFSKRVINQLDLLAEQRQSLLLTLDELLNQNIRQKNRLDLTSPPSVKTETSQETV